MGPRDGHNLAPSLGFKIFHGTGSRLGDKIKKEGFSLDMPGVSPSAPDPLLSKGVYASKKYVEAQHYALARQEEGHGEATILQGSLEGLNVKTDFSKSPHPSWELKKRALEAAQEGYDGAVLGDEVIIFDPRKASKAFGVAPSLGFSPFPKNVVMGKQLLRDIQTVKNAGLLNHLLTMKEVVDREAKEEARKKVERAFLKGLTPQEQIEYQRKRPGGWEDTDGMTFGGRSPNPFTKGADDPLPYRGKKLSLEERKYAPIEKSLEDVLGEYRDKKTRLIGELPPEDLTRLEKRSAELLNVEVPPIAKFSMRDWVQMQASGIPADQLFWKTNNFKDKLDEGLITKLNAYRFSYKGDGKQELARTLEEALSNPKGALSLRDSLVSRYEATLRMLRGSHPETANAVLGGMKDLGRLWGSTAYGKIKGNRDWLFNLNNPPPPERAGKVWDAVKRADEAFASKDHVGTSTSLLAAYSHREGHTEAGESFDRMSRAWRGAVTGNPITLRDKAIPSSDLIRVSTRKGVVPLGALENPPEVWPGTPEWVEVFNPRLVEQLDERGQELARVEENSPNFAAEKALGRMKPLRPGEMSTVEERAEQLSERNTLPQPVEWVDMPRTAVAPGRGRPNFYGELEEEPLPAPTFESVRTQKAKDALLDAQKKSKASIAPYWEDRKKVAMGEAERFQGSALEYADEVPPEVQASLDRMMRQAKAPITKRELRWLNQPVADARAALARSEAARPSAAWYKLRGAFSAVRNEYKQAGYAVLSNLPADLTKPDPPMRAVIIQAGEWAKEGLGEAEILERFGGKKFERHREMLKALFDESTPPPVGGLPEIPVAPEPINKTLTGKGEYPPGSFEREVRKLKVPTKLGPGPVGADLNAPVAWTEAEAAKALRAGKTPAPALAEAARWLEGELAPQAVKAVGKATRVVESAPGIWTAIRAILRGV